MWKDIYKIRSIKKQVEKNNKLNNHSNFVYSHIAPTRLLEQLISIISISLIFKAIISYFLNILLSNSDSIIVCDCIHLSLLLNQL